MSTALWATLQWSSTAQYGPGRVIVSEARALSPSGLPRARWCLIVPRYGAYCSFPTDLGGIPQYNNAVPSLLTHSSCKIHGLFPPPAGNNHNVATEGLNLLRHCWPEITKSIFFVDKMMLSWRHGEKSSQEMLDSANSDGTVLHILSSQTE